MIVFICDWCFGMLGKVVGGIVLSEIYLFFGKFSDKCVVFFGGIVKVEDLILFVLFDCLVC